MTPKLRLGIYLKELKAETPAEIYTIMFTATLFTKSEGRRTPSVLQWMNG